MISAKLGKVSGGRLVGLLVSRDVGKVAIWFGLGFRKAPVLTVTWSTPASEPATQA